MLDLEAAPKGALKGMGLEEFLHLHGADMQVLFQRSQTIVQCADGDRLLAVGSLVEGLGNIKSDVDLILASPQDQFEKSSPDTLNSFLAGRCIVDMRIVPAELVRMLTARLASWAGGAWDLSQAAPFSTSELLLLHRLQAGVLLWPVGDAGRPGAHRQEQAAIARLKLHMARHMARTIQVDMLGYRETQDYRSLVFASQDLLGHVVDGLLAGFGQTNPTPKWRSRLLERLPGDWEGRLVGRPSGMSANDLIWRLHRAPLEPSRDQALAHAGRVTTFSRSVFLWAEAQLITPGGPLTQVRVWPDDPSPQSAPPLPWLELDVDFCQTGDGMTLGRLNEFGQTVHLSPTEIPIALLFDNETTAEHAALAVSGGGEARQRVEQVALKLRQAGLSL